MAVCCVMGADDRDIREILEAGQIVVFAEHARPQPEEMRFATDAYDEGAGRQAVRAAADCRPLPPIGITCRHAGLVRMEICLTEKPLNAAACQQDVQRRCMVGKASKGNFVVSNLCFHRGPLSNDRSMVSAGADALIKSRRRVSEGLEFLCQAKLLA
jgi:hypothetical protein